MNKVAYLSGINALIRQNPAAASALIGGITGGTLAGSGYRTPGVVAGALAGLGGGVFGRGLHPALVHRGRRSKALLHLLGKDPLIHQLAGSGAGGLTAGVLVQPKPDRHLLSMGRTSDTSIGETPDQWVMNKAKSLIS